MEIFSERKWNNRLISTHTYINIKVWNWVRDGKTKKRGDEKGKGNNKFPLHAHQVEERETQRENNLRKTPTMKNKIKKSSSFGAVFKGKDNSGQQISRLTKNSFENEFLRHSF